MGKTRQEIEALEDRLLEFGARCGKVVDALPDTRLGRHLAGQLVRCGTSAAPNYLVPLTDECVQLMKIIGKSIGTAKANVAKRTSGRTER